MKMKKMSILMACALTGSMAFAQSSSTSSNSGTLTNKHGVAILPQAGDWGISFDASPIFHFVGNAFNGNTNNAAPGLNWLNGDQTIIGRKWIDSKTAYRALVRIGFSSSSVKNYVNKDNVQPPTFPDAPDQVTDKMSASAMTIGLGAGKEFHKGSGRLQGYYGADAMIWISNSKQKYTYGNAYNAANDSIGNAAPTSTDFTTMTTSGMTSRTTLNKQGMTFGIGVRGFIGVQYYIFPKISIGAEYGWGLGFQSTGEGEKDVETIGGKPSASTIGTVGTVKTKTAGSSMFGVDTDLNQGTMFGFHGSNTGSATLRVTFDF